MDIKENMRESLFATMGSDGLPRAAIRAATLLAAWPRSLSAFPVVGLLGWKGRETSSEPGFAEWLKSE